ncbi:uncharacterized protein LOC142540032 [Primulina tabacum]|uniref:uncharacterized protein LOC142540032 n=1 Tax=Primulina tabacum TaxID=48773 RepID=UPI003F596479
MEDFDFERKVRISPLPEPEPEPEQEQEQEQESHKIQIAEQASNSIVALLRRFLAVQHRRALAYTRLKRGFEDYMLSGGELAYQHLCSEITVEFNDCSKQVLEIEYLFMSPDCCREDLAQLLRSVQAQEKDKLHSTALIQVLKKAGCPSERLVSHANCRFRQSTEHECVHIQKITEASGTEEAEADAEYDNSLKKAIRGVQDAVVSINECLEEIRYEIAGLEAE